MEQEIRLNEHDKRKFPPSHVAEPDKSAIVLYTAEDNSIQLDIKLENETVWLSQKQIAELFDVKKAAISKHISNIFASEELTPDATVSKMETVQTEGNRQIRRLLECYNLDMILSIGYRVNSKRAVRFRQWANKVLKDYLVKGYAINQKITQQRYEELKDVVRLMSRTYQLQDAVTTEEADGLLTMMGPVGILLGCLRTMTGPIRIISRFGNR